MRYFVVAALILIIASLFSALYYVYKDRGTGSKRAVRALTIRVALSVSLFLMLVISIQMGWITGGRI